MGPYLGDYAEDDTVYFVWSSNGANGASITRATNGTVSVYKDNGTTQSTAGVTDTEDFDSLTGIHACTIDTSADAFYTAGTDYAVILSGATIDGQTVNAVLAHFSIENRTLKSGGIKSSTFAAGAINAAAIADNAIDAGAIAADAITAAKIADGAIDAATFAAGAITATVIATGAIDADAIAADAVTEIQSGLATAAALDTVDNFLDTEVAAILAAVDTEVAAIKAVTDLLPDAGALTSLATQASVNTIDDFIDTEIAAILAAVDTEVAAIKAKTDSLTFTVAGQVDANIQYVNDTAIQGDGSVGTDEWRKV